MHGGYRKTMQWPLARIFQQHKNKPIQRVRMRIRLAHKDTLKSQK